MCTRLGCLHALHLDVQAVLRVGQANVFAVVGIIVPARFESKRLTPEGGGAFEIVRLTVDDDPGQHALVHDALLQCDS